MFHLTAGNLFPPSSCKKQMNKQNSCLLPVRFRSGIRYERAQTFFARLICTLYIHERHKEMSYIHS